MKNSLCLMLVLIATLFGLEPSGKTTFWDKTQVISYIRVTPQYMTVAGTTAIDTTTYTSIVLPDKAMVPWISVVVRDTLESTGDTCLFRVEFNGVQVLRKSTAQCKIGNSTTAGVFRWDVNKEVSGALRIKVSRAAITEGNYYWLIPYYIRDNKP